MVTHDAAIADRALRQITVRDGLIASDKKRNTELRVPHPEPKFRPMPRPTFTGS
jgi:hypothetical protein